MLSYTFYKALHIIGIFIALPSIAPLLFHAGQGGEKKENNWRKLLLVGHGIGLFLIILGGFGMLARLGIHSIPYWIAIKLAIWLFLGAVVTIAYRKRAAAQNLWMAVITVAIIASFIGQFHKAM